MEEQEGRSQCWFPFKQAYHKRRRNWHQETDPSVYVFRSKGQNGKNTDYEISFFEYDGETSRHHVGETELVLKGNPIPSSNIEKPYRIRAISERTSASQRGESLPRALAAIEANPLSRTFWTEEVAVNGALCTQVTPSMDIRDEWKCLKSSDFDVQLKRVNSISQISSNEIDLEEGKNTWIDDDVSTDMVILREVSHDPDAIFERSNKQNESSHANSLLEEIRASIVHASLDASMLKMQALTQDSRNTNPLLQDSASLHSSLLISKVPEAVMNASTKVHDIDCSRHVNQKSKGFGNYPRRNEEDAFHSPDYPYGEYSEPAFSIEVEPLMEIERSGNTSLVRDGTVETAIAPNNVAVRRGQSGLSDVAFRTAERRPIKEGPRDEDDAIAVSFDGSSGLGERDANIVDQNTDPDDSPCEPGEFTLEATKSHPMGNDGGPERMIGSKDRRFVSMGPSSPGRHLVRKASSSLSRAVSNSVMRVRSKGSPGSGSGAKSESAGCDSNVVEHDPYLEELDRVVNSIHYEGAYPQEFRQTEFSAGYAAQSQSMSHDARRRGRYRSPAESLPPYQPRKARSEIPLPRSHSASGLGGRTRSGIETHTTRELHFEDPETNVGNTTNVNSKLVDSASAMSNAEHIPTGGHLVKTRHTPAKAHEKNFAVSGVPNDINIPRRRSSLEKQSTKTPSVIFAPGRNGKSKSDGSKPMKSSYSSKSKSSNRNQSGKSRVRTKSSRARRDDLDSDEDSLFSDLNSSRFSSEYSRGVESEVTTFTDYHMTEQGGPFSCMDGWID